MSSLSTKAFLFPLNHQIFQQAFENMNYIDERKKNA